MSEDIKKKLRDIVQKFIDLDDEDDDYIWDKYYQTRQEAIALLERIDEVSFD